MARPPETAPTAARGRAPRWRQLTLRRRLTIGLLALLASLIAGVGIAEVLVLGHVLYARSASGLRTELALLAAGAPPSPPGGPGRTTSVSRSCRGFGTRAALPPLPGPKGRPRGRTLGPGGAAEVAQVLAQRGVASAVVGPKGTILACASAVGTAGQGAFAVPASVVDSVEKARLGSSYVTLHSGGQHLLAISQPAGADTAILVTSLAGDDAAVSTVVAVTVIAGLGALALAIALSRPLLRSGLAPLTRVAATADAIAAGDLDRRAGLERSEDEVGRLGAAFDAMVDRLGASLEERSALVERLQAREETMRRFLADASHELRTPLTAIRGAAQVLRMGAADDPEELGEALGHIQAQAERMSRLVSDLLLLSRRDSGAPGRPHRSVDLGGLIAGERPQWAALCPQHPLRVDTEAAWVSADPDALVRLCANLVDNAAKYSPPGSPIHICVRPSNGRAELVVADRGPGIPAAERPLVFERFYRGDPARSRSTGGSGLGLAIVAAIAADHAGTVAAEENEAGGTRIVVNLPSSLPATPGEPAVTKNSDHPEHPGAGP